jgi:murein DD-endopeptidase MepM/ murein hydrolase activator NlpD
VYPTEPWGGQTVSSGYDLGRPDALQRRGAELSAIGHGGVDLPQERGAPVRAVALRGQQGDAELLYAGPLFGNTVVLSHVVREGSSTRVYLALHGHLDAIAPGLRRGQSIPAGTLLGAVGDSGAEGVVHLHYEVRLVRPGVDPTRVDRPGALVDQSVSVPCDPRNVLPLRPR